MKKIFKLTASLMIAWVFALAIAPTTALAIERRPAQGAIPSGGTATENFSLQGIQAAPNLFYDGQRVINLMFAPVAPTKTVDWETECIVTLQAWSKETVQYRDPATGNIKEATGWLSPGTSLVYRKDGTGIPWVHACGNGVPSLVGKEMPFGKRECAPVKTVTNTQYVPVPTQTPAPVMQQITQVDIENAVRKVVGEEPRREPEVRPKRNVPWGWIAAILTALGLGYLASQDDDPECPSCPTPPRPNP